MGLTRKCLALLTTAALSLLLSTTQFPAVGHAQSLAGETIRTCNDGGEWPPYFWKIRQGGEVTDDLTGYDLDYLQNIFDNVGADFTFELIAWSRCLHEVETGDSYDMVTSVAYSKERDQNYLMTDSYYTVQPHYFYPKANFPQGLEIDSLDAFAQYKVCGLRGYNYANFGIPTETIDTGTKVFSQLIEKTARGRCDMFLGRYEIFAGFAKTGNDYITRHDLETAPMPGVPGDKFYMMVSRNYEHAEDLVAMLNEGIARLKASGEADVMLQPYLE